MGDPTFPPPVMKDLEGWRLIWYHLLPGPAGEVAPALWAEAAQELEDRLQGRALSELPLVASVRALFRKAGCDPTRYRPSSEALARRVLKGKSLGPIHPFVDLNNLLSVWTLLPCCVVDPRHLEPPFRLRRGEEGETMLSMRGPFSLGGKPVLSDGRGPFGTPITDSERVKVTAATRECWLVAYSPEGFEDTVPAVLPDLAARSGTAHIAAGPIVV